MATEAQIKANKKNAQKAGRPKGAKSAKTLEREKVLEAFRQKAMKAAGVLFNSQFHLATGQTFLYKIQKELKVGPKGGKSYVKSRPILVTSQDEIESFLMGEIVQGDMDDDRDPNSTYYFLTTKEPDNKAIDSLLNRTFGTPTQMIGGDPENPIEHSVVYLPSRSEKKPEQGPEKKPVIKKKKKVAHKLPKRA